MISSESSIETLPDFAKNGLFNDRNVINDQTIANYCSDTVRELNNLTEELHHTDLHMERHKNSRNLENGIDATTNKINDDGVMMHEHRRQTLQEITNNHHHNNHPVQNQSMQSNSSRLYERNCNGQFGDDAVDSSPFFTQLNQQLEENNFCNSIDERDNRHSLSYERSLTPADSIDGRIGNGNCTIDDSDEFRMATCMLQSVDLRGTQH